jgi:hypothetical protein
MIMANRTITTLYDNYDDAAQAVRDLEAAGVPPRDISLVANDLEGREKKVSTTEAGPGASTGAAVGGVAVGAAGVLAGLGMLAIPGIGPVVAAGWLIAGAVGAVAGGAVGAATGGVVGSLIAAGVDRDQANLYAEGLRRGGTVVSAKVDDDHIAAAERILSLRAVDYAARNKIYREAGWSQFDQAAPPYTLPEVEAERRRYR